MSFQSDEQRKAVMAILKKGKWKVKVTNTPRRGQRSGSRNKKAFNLFLLNTNMPKARAKARELHTKQGLDPYVTNAFDEAKRLMKDKRYAKYVEQLLGVKDPSRLNSPTALAKRAALRYPNSPIKDKRRYYPYGTRDGGITPFGKLVDGFSRTKLYEELNRLKQGIRLHKYGIPRSSKSQVVGEIWAGSESPDDLGDYYFKSPALEKLTRDYARTHTEGLVEDMDEYLRGNRIGSALYVLSMREAKRRGFKGIISSEFSREEDADKVWLNIRSGKRYYGSRGQFKVDVMDSVRPHAKRRGKKLRKKRK